MQLCYIHRTLGPLWGKSCRNRTRISQMLLVFGLLFIIVTQEVQGIRWIGIANGRQRFWNKTSDCSRARRDGLIKQQVMLCKRYLEFMSVVAHSARAMRETCKEHFRNRRWNCSTVDYAPHFKADLTEGSREQALTFAFSSAALTQAISRACATGSTTKCSCGRIPNEPPPGNFKWGGCGDDLRFGLSFSEMFADAEWVKKKKASKKSLMNLHNTAAGRKIVLDSLQTSCKCHGVSGSCSIKTCWKALPSIQSIGTTLQKRYAIAVEVESRKINQERRLLPVNKRRDFFAEDELVYYRKSSDYCSEDDSSGSLGTRGRECKKDDTGSGGCQSMCCGRGYTSRIVEVRHRCDCKYYWCCYVKCKTCTKKVEINRCR